MPQNLQLPQDWMKLLHEEFNKPYFQQIKQFLKKEIKEGQTIFPPQESIFEAFKRTKLKNLKVIVLGQDPYHSTEFIETQELPHAHGLSFSIPPQAKKIPPSLKNIYKELLSDLGETNYIIPNHGNLIKWSDQGVLLLNSSLTVQAHEANSHKKIGWQNFTDKVIQKISDQTDHKVFILWGNYARSKEELIDHSRHLVLESPHPSPFSARKGFFGSKPFSKSNQYLSKHGHDPIDWQS